MSQPGLLVVNSSSSWGGNEHWAVSVAQGMAQRGHRVRFLWSCGVVGERVKGAGLDGAEVHLGGDADPRGVLALREHMVAIQARTVLLTRWREYLHGGLAARLAGRPKVVLRLGLKVVPRGDLKRRLAFGLADRVIVNAPEIRDALAALSWIDSRKIQVVVNGTELDRWHPGWTVPGQKMGRQFRQENGIASDAPLVVTVGNLTGQKDHPTLLAACAQVQQHVPGLRVLIFGEGPQREELARQIQQRNLENTVSLAGFIADVAPALAAANLFVLSSRNEGMARALVEAAASGLPTVTTDVSGARWCVQDGKTGLVVPVGEAAALAVAMTGLLNDGTASEAMGRRARQLAQERFSLPRMLDETADVLF